MIRARVRNREEGGGMTRRKTSRMDLDE